MNEIVVPRWLGMISYEKGIELQESLVRSKTTGSEENHLLLLEHDPVYTMGRMRDETSLGDEKHLPHPVRRTNRGGQATYHGPGQLVGYPVLDLQLFGKDLHAYLRFLEEVLIALSARHGIIATRHEGKTGVWVEDRKIASLGVGVRRWISMHGFAININGDLAPFHHITPCGLVGVEMTSLEAEGAKNVTVETCAREVGLIFNELIQQNYPSWTQKRGEN